MKCKCAARRDDCNCGVRYQHKGYVYGIVWTGPGPRMVLWYASCRVCDWEMPTPHRWPDGTFRYGRPTWDAAFALAIGHIKEKCKHG